MKLLLLSRIFEESIECLREAHDVIEAFDATPDELQEMIADREALVFRSGVDVSAELMARAPGLKLLIRAGSGLDNIDLDYVSTHGLELIRIPGPGARAVSELAFSFMLALTRQIIPADRMLRAGHWAKHELSGYLLEGKTLGVYGAGNIGSLVGRMGAAWGMNVLACVECPSEEREKELRQQNIRLVDADAVVSNSDFLSINLPLSATTRGLIDANTITRMKAGSYLVNLARGGIVDENALFDALTSGRLRGAALDVHAAEGEGKISVLAELPNVILTPHIGAMTVDSQRAVGERVVEIVGGYS